MKKRIFWIAIAVAAVSIFTGFTGCTDDDTAVRNNGTTIARLFSCFETIDGTECLSYDTNTGIVYYL